MSFMLTLVLANILVASLAIFGVSKCRHRSIGYLAGLSALMALPLADVSFLVFLLEGIPYFSFPTPAGISLMVTGVVALVGAVFSSFAALRSKR